MIVSVQHELSAGAESIFEACSKGTTQFRSTRLANSTTPIDIHRLPQSICAVFCLYIPNLMSCADSPRLGLSGLALATIRVSVSVQSNDKILHRAALFPAHCRRVQPLLRPEAVAGAKVLHCVRMLISHPRHHRCRTRCG
jgi:hypothetical protein